VAILFVVKIVALRKSCRLTNEPYVNGSVDIHDLACRGLDHTRVIALFFLTGKASDFLDRIDIQGCGRLVEIWRGAYLLLELFVFESSTKAHCLLPNVMGKVLWTCKPSAHAICELHWILYLAPPFVFQNLISVR
jgi:hypothetical protein